MIIAKEHEKMFSVPVNIKKVVSSEQLGDFFALIVEGDRWDNDKFYVFLDGGDRFFIWFNESKKKTYVELDEDEKKIVVGYLEQVLS